ncbi:hypothetical protein BIW11_03221 [Tropilaelaps mercedesae]|uniref:Uncharacterized protein n=1 Tax=Tropilaelaps mercedesae TaxID=418985 RepID=A0A1V9XQL6_9ACAR|nr:hypothetical protein BIW11_03221 [Tropilaelaps mercedesae]
MGGLAIFVSDNADIPASLPPAAADIVHLGVTGRTLWVRKVACCIPDSVLRRRFLQARLDVMDRRLILFVCAVILLIFVPDLTNAGFGLKKLAKAALLGAAIAPRFVPIPIP